MVASHDERAVRRNRHWGTTLIDCRNREAIARLICNGDHLIVHGDDLHRHIVLRLDDHWLRGIWLGQLVIHEDR